MPQSRSRGGGPQRFEHDLIRDGSQVSVAVSRRPVFDGRVYSGLSGAGQQRTEEARASEAAAGGGGGHRAPCPGEFSRAVRFLAQALRRCKIVFVTDA
jgi:hypothetical protein